MSLVLNVARNYKFLTSFVGSHFASHTSELLQYMASERFYNDVGNAIHYAGYSFIPACKVALDCEFKVLSLV